MSFETISGTKKYIKANSLEVGQSLEGFVVGKHNSEKFPEIDSLVMKINNEDVVLNPNGSLKYFFKNGNATGYYYRFTRLPDVKTARGLTSSQFKIEIDKSKKLDANEPVAAQAVTEDIKF
jgi:hypothetical protein